MALHTALRYNKPLAGVLALSTYLPLKPSFPDEKSPQNQRTPIFMAHGTNDDLITMETSRVSLSILQAEHYQVQWHEYAMGHCVSMEEIDDIRSFLLSIMNWWWLNPPLVMIFVKIVLLVIVIVIVKTTTPNNNTAQ